MLGGDPSQGSRRREAPVGLVSLSLLCPRVQDRMCLWTNTVCLGEGFLPQAQLPLSLYTDSPSPPRSSRTTVFGINRWGPCREQRDRALNMGRPHVTLAI